MLQHTLIVGTTGSGKSYLERMMIDRMAGKCRLILIDPKRTELWDYEQHEETLFYADCPTRHYDAIIRAYDQMNSRFEDMRKRHLREWDGLPLYVFIDEAGALMNDRRHRRAYVEMLGNVAMMGRSARVFIVWCTQVPTKQCIPNEISDNLPCKVCLRLDTPNRARFVFGFGHQYGELPRHGYGYVKTPDILGDPRKMEVGDEMLAALGM